MVLRKKKFCIRPFQDLYIAKLHSCLEGGWEKKSEFVFFFLNIIKQSRKQKKHKNLKNKFEGEWVS